MSSLVRWQPPRQPIFRRRVTKTVRVPVLPLAETLADNFNDNSLDTSLWTTVIGGAGSVTESSQQLNISETSASVRTQLASVNRYSIDESYVLARLAAFSLPASATTTLRLATTQGTPGASDEVYAVGLRNNAGATEFAVYRLVAGGSTTLQYSEAYNASQHVWFRIREAGGTAFFESSPDGSSWTTEYSEAYGLATTNFFVELSAATGTSGTTTTSWDSVNSLPATVTGAAVLTGTGSLLATGSRTRFGAAVLSGTGSLTATGVRIRLGAAVLTGTGSLTATGVRTRFGAAVLSGSGALVVNFPTSSLTDNFDDNSIDATKWVSVDDGGAGGGSNTETGQQMVVLATSPRRQHLRSKDRFNLEDSYVFVKLVGVSFVGSSGSPNVRIRLTNRTDTTVPSGADDELSIEITSNISCVRLASGGARSGVFSEAYSTTDHAWLRIRELAGTTYWDKSSDGASWSMMYSEATTVSTMMLYAHLGSFATGGGTTTGTFDNFNVAPAVIVPRPVIVIAPSVPVMAGRI